MSKNSEPDRRIAINGGIEYCQKSELKLKKQKMSFRNVNIRKTLYDIIDRR